MNRKEFLKILGAFNVLLFAGKVGAENLYIKQPLRFGVLTDTHYANREKSGSRYYTDSLQKLKNAMEHFKQANVEFVIELGDFKDESTNPNKEETLTFLSDIEKVYQSYDIPAYHVLGNHDMDSISKDDFLQHTTNPGRANGKSYYSFVSKGIKFIVLDANYNIDGTDYNCGNFDWSKALIPEKQINWLKKELRKGDEPIFIFIHQLLGGDTDKRLFVHNYEEVQQILSNNKRVLAVLQGHHHAGGFVKVADVSYITIPGMVEGSFPYNTSFAIAEIQTNGTLQIKGFGSCEDRKCAAPL